MQQVYLPSVYLSRAWLLSGPLVQNKELETSVMWIFNLFTSLGKRIERNFIAFNRKDIRIKRVVAITGCDSGLGWALAARSAREGLVTIAGMFQGTDTEAAEALRKLCAHPYSLDVTNPESVAGFKDYVNSVLKDNPNYKLHAVVNNAGVMTIGNYEWQTPAMIENTINVNLLGAMRVASAFLPSLRRSALENQSSMKPRLINVASHCGLQPLPSFGPYCASKAGLVAWTRVLRSEHHAMGLAALAFLPGGFVSSSNIMAKQSIHGKEMMENFTEEQRNFYESQLTALNNYLGMVPGDVRFDSLREERIIETFMKALTEDDPAELYKEESWRYKIYYGLMKLPFPESVQRWLVKRFVSLPNVL